MTRTVELADRSPSLPIDALRADVLAAFADGPVVISSPTGSGKSTQVPRWCPGRVLVVEPRRVACRSLAQRVAMLEGVRLGEEVGYLVRDESRASDATRILFATPGVVLRLFNGRGAWSLDRFDTVVLDEFHERGLDVDLLLALLHSQFKDSQFKGRLAVMSATLDGERVAAHLGGRHLHAEGRLYPVEIVHLPGDALLPDAQGLEQRVRRAVEVSREHPGDVLVFLPGKGEIAGCAASLRDARDEIFELHGGLTLEAQSRVFEPSARRKVILATNVAETSLTVPGVGVVVDSGLVRRTRYHRDRGFLTLAAVARDSAEQRAGRAGRTAPGVAYRLWSEAAHLEERTPPEIERESLVPLVHAAAACGARVEELDFFDPPPEHAVETAREQLLRLGALDGDGALTPCGRELFGLPLDVGVGRILVEAQARDEGAGDLLDDAIDLVAVLAGERPLWTLERASEALEAVGTDPHAAGCDACAAIRVLRRGGSGSGHPALGEARRLRTRLRRAFGRSGAPPEALDIDRRRLALTLLAADPGRAHVARRRGRRTAWAGGAAELDLGRDCAASRREEAAPGGRGEEVEALVMLATRALGVGRRDTRLLITCALPVPLGWLVEAGLGRDRLGEVRVEKRDGAPWRVVGEIERVFAGRVLATRDDVPRGELARRAVATLFLRGSLFRGSLEETRERLRQAALARSLATLAASPWSGSAWAEMARAAVPVEVPELEEWVAAKLEELGVESGEDVQLLTEDDFLAEPLPPLLAAELEREMPGRLEILGIRYTIRYDVGRREAVLRQDGGRVKHQIPPTFALPRLAGFRIRIEHRGAVRALRE